MITKNDCLLLLSELKGQGVNTDEQFAKLLKQSEPTIETIAFINENRQLDLTAFYKKLKKSYNKKNSKLYINIVKDIDDPVDVLTTLSALETQVLLFAKGLENKQMFLRHARAEEISLVLHNYFKTYDITNCIKLLRLIKSDIKALEIVDKGKI